MYTDKTFIIKKSFFGGGVLFCFIGFECCSGLWKRDNQIWLNTVKVIMLLIIFISVTPFWKIYPRKIIRTNKKCYIYIHTHEDVSRIFTVKNWIQLKYPKAREHTHCSKIIWQIILELIKIIKKPTMFSRSWERVYELASSKRRIQCDTHTLDSIVEKPCINMEKLGQNMKKKKKHGG